MVWRHSRGINMDTLINFWQGIAVSGNPFGNGTGSALNSYAQTMDMPHLLALAAAMGWASGLRLYLVLFITGLASTFGWIPLPPGLHVLQHPAMLAASGFMLFVEFFADKIPGVDSLWDLVHSVIRVPTGAALAAGVFGADSATMATVAGVLGGTLSATSFATKATTRAAVNTSPEPFSNIAVSLVEDGAVMGAMWLATNYPVAFGIALIIVLALSVLLLMLLAKYLKIILGRISKWFGKNDGSPSIVREHELRISTPRLDKPKLITIFCIECGASIGTASKFCDACGVRIMSSQILSR